MWRDLTGQGWEAGSRDSVLVQSGTVFEPGIQGPLVVWAGSASQVWMGESLVVQEVLEA